MSHATEPDQPSDFSATNPTLELPERKTDAGEASDARTLPEDKSSTNALPSDEKLPGLPGFTLLKTLGAGGMGIVYLARQHSPQRLVALKMIRGGHFAHSQERERLHAEANAIAALNHAHIVQIYLVGEIEGLPYLVLEYCSGGSLQERLRRQLPSPEESAGLVRTLAAALEEVHRRAKLIHRDLKPANVLLTEDGTPKITDFGLAKANEDGSSVSGRIAGTPSYMSPEQAQGAPVDPRSDVYSLGAILYECLTGRPPFLGASVPETLLQVTEEDPVPVQRLVRTVPRDLAVICHKCLNKSPQRRYASAQELANDLGRFLNHAPIQARPIGLFERVWLWARRHRALAILGGVTSLALLALLVTAFYFTATLAAARQEEQFARLREQDAGRLAAAQHFFGLRMAVRERSTRRPPGWTRENQKELGEAVTLADAATHQPDLRSEWLLARSVVDLIPRSPLRSVDWPYSLATDPKGRWLAVGERGSNTGALAGAAMRVVLVDPHTGQTVRTLKAPQKVVWKGLNPLPDYLDCLRFSPEGRWLAAGTRSGEVQVWDLQTDRETPVGSWSAGKAATHRLAFSPDSRWIYAANSEGHVLERREVGTWKLLGRVDNVRDFDVHPQSGIVLTDSGRTLHARLDGDCQPGVGPHGLVRFAPDGTWMAAVSQRDILLREVRTRELLHHLRIPRGDFTLTGHISAVEISPDGLLIAAFSRFTSEARLYEVIDGRLVATLSLPSDCHRLAFGPDSRSLWIVADREVLGYEILLPDFGEPCAVRGGEVSSITWHPDGSRWALSRHRMEEVPWHSLGPEIYDRFPKGKAPSRIETAYGVYEPPPRPRLVFQSRALVGSRRWDPPLGGQLLSRMELTGNNSPATVVVTQPSTGKSEPIENLIADPEDNLWMLSQGGAILALESENPGTVWARWEQVNLGQSRRGATCLAVSVRWVVAGGIDGLVWIFPRKKGELRQAAAESLSPTRLSQVAISSDERWAVLADETRRFHVVELPSGKSLYTSAPLADSVTGISAGAAGLFATGTAGGEITVWHWNGTTAQRCFTLPHDGSVEELRFSPDGRILLTRGFPHFGVRFWSLEQIWDALAKAGLGKDLPALRPNPLPPAVPLPQTPPRTAPPPPPARGVMIERFADTRFLRRSFVGYQDLIDWSKKQAEDSPDVPAIRWSGYLKLPVDGLYNFAVRRHETGDCRVWLDGTLLIDLPPQGATTNEFAVTVNLKAGLVPIRMDTVQHWNPVIRLQWKPPGDAELSTVPAEVLFPTREAGK